MKSTVITFGLLLWGTVSSFSQNADTLDIDIAKGEHWWGGLSTEGHNTPYDSHSKVTHDLWANNEGNQAQPRIDSRLNEPGEGEGYKQEHESNAHEIRIRQMTKIPQCR